MKMDYEGPYYIFCEERDLESRVWQAVCCSAGARKGEGGAASALVTLFLSSVCFFFLFRDIGVELLTLSSELRVVFLLWVDIGHNF